MNYRWSCEECKRWFIFNKDYPLLTEDNVKVCADCFYLIKQRNEVYSLSIKERKELEYSSNEDEDYDSERYYTV